MPRLHVEDDVAGADRNDDISSTIRKSSVELVLVLGTPQKDELGWRF